MFHLLSYVVGTKFYYFSLNHAYTDIYSFIWMYMTYLSFENIKAICYFFQKQSWGISFKMVDSLVLPPESLMKWKHQKTKRKNSIRLKRVCWKRTLNEQEISTNFWKTKQELEMRCQMKQWGDSCHPGPPRRWHVPENTGEPPGCVSSYHRAGRRTGGAANRGGGVTASSLLHLPTLEQSLQAAQTSVRTDKHLGVHL